MRNMRFGAPPLYMSALEAVVIRSQAQWSTQATF